MKTLKYVLVLFIFIGLLMSGCSDKSQLPVDPNGKSASLEKSFTREFTATVMPGIPTNPGIYKYPDGKVLTTKYLGPATFTAAYLPGDTGPDILSGVGEVEINGITDMTELIGKWHGKLRFTPANAGGGSWQFTWHGSSTFSQTAWMGGPGWIIPLQEVGHGEGGEINGMQCHMEVTIYGALDFSNWYGEATGTITSH